MKHIQLKKILLLIPPVLVFAGILAYAFIPQVKTFIQQGFRLTEAAAAHYELTDTVDAMNIRQVITADSTTSRTIMWQSALAEEDAVVEYRRPNDTTTQSASVQSEAFTDDNQTTYIHTITLTGLTPGMTYEYRVGYGTKRSAWQTLTTATGTDFKALIFPDSQSSDYSVWRDTAKPAWDRNKDANFFINMGDLVDNGQDQYQWNAWFDVVSPMTAVIPVAPIMGNHETYTLDWKVRMPEAYTHLFSLPGNGLKQYQNQFYSFDYGDVHFVVLNTQTKELEDLEPHLLADQQAWFKADMAQTTKKWKVVVMHKDSLQYAFQSRPQPREEGFSEEGKEWMPLFDAYSVDVVLSAHLHTYRDRGHIQNFQRSDKGPLYIITGVAGNVRYPSLWRQHSLDEYTAPQPETDNYLVLTATANTLTFTGYLPSGEELHSTSISK